MRGGADLRVLLLDSGGVIVPAAGPETVSALEHELGLEPGQLGPLMYECDLWYDISTGRITEDDYWAGLAAALRCAENGLRDRLLPIWQPMVPDWALIELVREVRPRLRAAVLSNATLGLEDHLARLGVAQLFDPIINSSRVGLRKPDSGVFEHALEILGVAPEHVLFVDDKERNTLVAAELGIPSVVYQGAAHLREMLRTTGLLPMPTP